MSKRNYLGDDGKFKPALLADAILAKNKFITIRQTDKIKWYDAENGYYCDRAESIIAEFVKEDLGDEYTSRIKNEVIANIMALTYIEQEELDKNKNLINMPNGVYSVKDKVLLEHRPEYYFTSVMPYKYNKEAKADEILNFLWSVSNHRFDMFFSLLEHIAWTLMPRNKFQKMALLWGEGSNGKGTYLILVKNFAGKDNCASANLEQLTNQRFHVAGLYGKKVNLAGDINHNEPLENTAILKQLRGEDTLTGEFKNGQPFQFVFDGKCFFAANKFPKTTDDTYGFNRSFSILKFEAQFTDENGAIDEDIISKITQESQLSGLFNIAVEILEILNKNTKFTFAYTPEEIRQIYKEKSDSAAWFIEQKLCYDPNGELFKVELQEIYKQFCKDNRLITESEKAFKNALDNSGIRYGEGQKELRRFWKGLAFKKMEQQEQEPEKEQIPTNYQDFIRFYQNKTKSVTQITALTAYFSFVEYPKN